MLEIIHSSKLSYDNTKSWGSNHCISVYGQRVQYLRPNPHGTVIRNEYHFCFLYEQLDARFQIEEGRRQEKRSLATHKYLVQNHTCVNGWNSNSGSQHQARDSSPKSR